MKKQIPNLFTLLNLVFGCLAIVAIMQNGVSIQYDANGAQFVDVPREMWWASLFILIAAVVDFFDGFLARLLGASSEMGKQLDSLADVVSFGVAPSLIIYQFLRMSYASGENALQQSTWLLAPAFILAAAGAYRLARYNISVGGQKGFSGVPIPAVGLVVASFPLIYWNTSLEVIINLLVNKWFLYIIIMALSWLMVSTLPMIDMKFEGLGVKKNAKRFILIGLSLVAALLLQWVAVPVIFLLYIILSLAGKKKSIQYEV